MLPKMRPKSNHVKLIIIGGQDYPRKYLASSNWQETPVGNYYYSVLELYSGHQAQIPRVPRAGLKPEHAHANPT